MKSMQPTGSHPFSKTNLFYFTQIVWAVEVCEQLPFVDGKLHVPPISIPCSPRLIASQAHVDPALRTGVLQVQHPRAEGAHPHGLRLRLRRADLFFGMLGMSGAPRVGRRHLLRGGRAVTCTHGGGSGCLEVQGSSKCSPLERNMAQQPVESLHRFQSSRPLGVEKLKSFKRFKRPLGTSSVNGSTESTGLS